MDASDRDALSARGRAAARPATAALGHHRAGRREPGRRRRHRLHPAQRGGPYNHRDGRYGGRGQRHRSCHLGRIRGGHGDVLRHRGGFRALGELRHQPRHLGRILMTAGTAGAATGRPRPPGRHSGPGVQVTVTDAGRLAAARGMLEADLAAVDLACSRFRPDSEIVALDRATGGGDAGPVTVSPLLAEAIAVALRAARLTDGDVDPTVGAAMNAVGYDRDFSQVQRNGPAVRLTVKTIPGWRQVEFDEQARLLRVPPGVRPRPGCHRQGLGGRPLGRPHRGSTRLWGAGQPGRGHRGERPAPGGRLADPGAGHQRPSRGPAGRAVKGRRHPRRWPGHLQHAARRWRRGGYVLHHILDPRTGLPAAPVWRTVSVAAASCTDANIASTAAIIRGRAAPAWLAGLGLPARLVDEAGQVRTIGGWPAETAGGTYEPAAGPRLGGHEA